MSARVRLCNKCNESYFQILTKDYETPITIIECVMCGESLLLNSNYMKETNK